MKYKIQSIVAMVSALVLLVGFLPASVFAEDGASGQTYTVSGLTSENVTVKVNGTEVTPNADGCITVSSGDEVRVTPKKGYEITGFQRPAHDPVIILNYPQDIWGDGTGYQMVLDADAVEYDRYASKAPLYFSDYYDSFDAFEYFVPIDADYGTAPQNFVYCESVSITVPAGTYDYFILVQGYHGIVTASSEGNVSGVTKGQVFESDNTYEFTITKDPSTGNSDRVDLNITQSVSGDYGTPADDGSYFFTMPAEDVALSITLTEFRYELTEGDNSVYDPESGTPLRFVFKRSLNDDVTFDRFTDASLDGNELTEGVDYTKTRGSVIIDIEPEYLNTLPAGEHALTVSFADADGVSVSFRIAAPPVPPEIKDDVAPNTGVSGQIWLYVWLVALMVLAAYELKVRRQENR